MTPHLTVGSFLIAFDIAMVYVALRFRGLLIFTDWM